MLLKDYLVPLQAHIDLIIEDKNNYINVQSSASYSHHNINKG